MQKTDPEKARRPKSSSHPKIVFWRIWAIRKSGKAREPLFFNEKRLICICKTLNNTLMVLEVRISCCQLHRCHHRVLIKHVQCRVSSVLFNGKNSCYIRQGNKGLILQPVPEKVQIIRLPVFVLFPDSENHIPLQTETQEFLSSVLADLCKSPRSESPITDQLREMKTIFGLQIAASFGKIHPNSQDSQGTGLILSEMRSVAGGSYQTAYVRQRRSR